jgi:2-polyprenyl-3-methyl-5-hydroxy-6-metoxy-1,4-benzoquinol methylase
LQPSPTKTARFGIGWRLDGVPQDSDAVWDDPATEWALQHYVDAYEQNRLQSGAGLLEFARTVEILQRHLPPPARIADVGAGPGTYSIWLAQLGHRVVARDLLPEHVEQLRSDARDHGLLIEAEVGDARELNLAARQSTLYSSLVRSTT